ncbi:UvrD-helicase domain-containing protein [Psychrobacter cryohalolentis]|uniref:RecBCD enzyme subunit RecB n=1 Tax=Psychrobacter cryohalolentis (strain ATCC BAA-1226 / DSM 17306 / VKM B-2378 / K5) TaxID=335284 RepID=Q1QB81_PSYCK|nr:UvrD-helicase domain-containing protein [Psychrobacter cryohalolentis]ABE75072.1 UvrD/REP helicase [Psychrobacter cryohalolentis K5]ASE25275.1 exodeoxyribonuclease V subunit beta [Psychrobacter cryohalolentis]
MTDFTDPTNTTDSFTQSDLFDEYSDELTLSAVPERKNDVIPAVDVDLTGKHLIEASAGTGKTWTLTGIVLRLLIEARRAPEQIIATTFTRAAAAEMRQRIHDRLVDFYQLLQWVNSLSAEPNNKDALYPDVLQVMPESNKDKQAGKGSSVDSNAGTGMDEFNKDIAADRQAAAEKRKQVKKDRENWLVNQAKYARLDAVMDDPINLHLTGFLLDHVHGYPMAEAIRRTALVLTTLDKLFVGTLDSLAQKWLIEYSSETGHQQGMAIIEDSSIEQVTDSIIHDELRQFQSRLYYEQPKLYALMDQQGKLTAVSDHKKYVTRSLKFISAPIDEIKLEQGFDFGLYERLLNEFAQLDLVDIQPYLNPDYRKSQGFRGGSNLTKQFDAIIDVHQKILEYQLTFNSYLNESENKILTSLQDARYPDEDGKIKNFNKNKEKEHQTLFELETISKLMVLLDMLDSLNQHILLVLANLNRHIVLAVRDRLPVILEERGETTFSLQMVRLNQALTGRQGDKLARYIRHHYPVALIDESQDINGEQAIMIESIYLPKNKRKQSDSDKQSTTNKTSHEFLLLVGDPKQAIYGFRGGDVANYNYMKAQFEKSSLWTLDINRRSNAGVIDALNCWFGMPTETAADNKLAQLGSSIYYQHIKASKPENQLSWFNEPTTQNSALVTEVLSAQPVSLLHLPYDKDKELEYDEFEITARHIATLLSSNQTLKGKPIQPSDIGVLARTKKDLKRVEDELVKLNVPTLTTSDVSIFETIMAEDVAALLSAMLYPYRHDMINRVLTSHLYGLSIKEVKAMMTDHESGVTEGSYLSSASTKAVNNKKSYQDFITYLKQAAQNWQHFGVLSALHYLLDKNPVQPQGVWQALATHPEGDRHIMDLRHMMDVLAQYGIGMGEHELLAWFRQNIDAAPSSDWAKQYPLPTESGVQLMTIHKSKGLEFPIVYVLGMGDASRKAGNNEKFGLYLYNAQQAPSILMQQSAESQSTGNQRRFSPVRGSATTEDCYTEIETKEGFDELRRLGYVAFTRASEQLYVVLRDPNNKTGFELKPAFYWLESPEAKFDLPDRLKGIVGMLRGHNVNEFYNNDSNGANALGLAGNATLATAKSITETIEYAPFAEVMKTNYFYGWAKTSFTALARQLDESTQALAVVDERMDDAIDIDMTESVVSSSNSGFFKPVSELSLKSEDDIRFTFVKGANAGTFLHEIFEKIDFNNKSQWSQVIDRAVSSYQLPLVYSSAEQQSRLLQANNRENGRIPDLDSMDATKHEALLNWFEEVLKAPLLASNQPLQSINASQRFAELEFNMGLSERFKAQDINSLFQQYLPNEVDKHVNLVPQNKTHLYRYLRGEIDLVYEHAGKYYVVDYKSNFLGNSLSDYDVSTLKQAMSKAGYWLQAAIYQVALHRFLAMRISDYAGNEDKYLGAVEYVFLRGVYDPNSQIAADLLQDVREADNSHSMPNDRYGLVTWDIPIEFIKALDALFGLPD